MGLTVNRQQRLTSLSTPLSASTGRPAARTCRRSRRLGRWRPADPERAHRQSVPRSARDLARDLRGRDAGRPVDAARRRELMRRHAGATRFPGVSGKESSRRRPASGAAGQLPAEFPAQPADQPDHPDHPPAQARTSSMDLVRPKSTRTPDARPTARPSPRPGPRRPGHRLRLRLPRPGGPVVVRRRLARDLKVLGAAGPRSGWPTRSRLPRCTSTSSISAAVSAPRCC